MDPLKAFRKEIQQQFGCSTCKYSDSIALKQCEPCCTFSGNIDNDNNGKCNQHKGI